MLYNYTEGHVGTESHVAHIRSSLHYQHGLSTHKRKDKVVAIIDCNTNRNTNVFTLELMYKLHANFLK